MRTSLLAFALLAAAPAFAATSVHSADGISPIVAMDAAASSVDAAALPAVRVVINTPMVLTASLELQTEKGQVVRSYDDRLLWAGESVVDLDVEDLPAGTYNLVVTTSLGSQSHTVVVP